MAEELGASVVWNGSGMATVIYDSTAYEIKAGEETVIDEVQTGKAVLSDGVMPVSYTHLSRALRGGFHGRSDKAQTDLEHYSSGYIADNNNYADNALGLYAVGWL